MALSLLTLVSVLSFIQNSNGIRRWDVFSTKTKYEWAHSSRASLDEHFSFNDGSNICKAVQVNMVSRHGVQWPSEDVMEDIKEVHESILESKSSNAYPALNSWISRYDESNENQLTTAGQIEQQELGARISLRFKTLFENNGRYIKYISSSKSETKNSNEFLYRGLSRNIRSLVEFSNEANDALMRSFDDCDNYEESVESDEKIEELNDFIKSLIFANITATLKEKLGASFDPSVDEIVLINELCAYEREIFNEESVWCELLTDDDRDILEYRSDIKNYFESSYGNGINSKISCPLLRDMFHTMDNAINKEWDYSNLGDVSRNGYLAGKFYNGHTHTLIPLMTSLELFKDDTQLLLSNIEAMVNRKFQTSKICPYSANLAFVLYACDDSSNITNITVTARSFMVKLFVNEQPISIPACKADTCLYDTARQYYSDLIDKCDLESFCDDDDCEDGKCGANSLGVSLVFVHVMALILKLL